MTFRHWSRVTPYTSSCELAECCVFGKQSPGPLRCDPPPLTPQGDHGRGHPFSRSYGVNLPSSLTWLLSRTLGFSPRPPVSVCGTDSAASTLRSFSRRRSIGRSALSEDSASRHVSGLMARGICLPGRPTRLDCLFQQTAGPACRVTPSLRSGSTGLLTRCPSTTPVGLALGSD